MRQFKFRTFVKKEEKMIYGREALVVRQFTPNYAYLDNEVEVMQWTGLKDVNGTEIFEGDIVNTHEGNFTVEWDEIGGMFLFQSGGLDYYEFEERYSSYEFYVIGNIHEHPDLV